MSPAKRVSQKPHSNSNTPESGRLWTMSLGRSSIPLQKPFVSHFHVSYMMVPCICMRLPCSPTLFERTLPISVKTWLWTSGALAAASAAPWGCQHGYVSVAMFIQSISLPRNPVVPNLRLGTTGPDNGTHPSPTFLRRYLDP